MSTRRSDRTVGIWRREGDRFVRAAADDRDPRTQHERWADHPSIEPRSERRRIAWIGESVARGFFFDPEVTPAARLAAQLDADVVDLAANDLQLDDLLGLVRDSVLLEPDAIVIFAGNNWSRCGYRAVTEDPERRRRAAERLERDGVAGFRDEIDRATTELVGHAARFLSRAARRIAIPFVVVVPEIARDWQPDPTSGLPYLPRDANRRWWELAARESHPAGRQRELDGGLVASTLAALGESAAAMAAASWDRPTGTPRCTPQIQELLRALADDAITVVDLPSVLAANSPACSRLLDYCHLDARGIEIAVDAIAAALDPSCEPLETPFASAAAISRAHVLAAIHHAHWGQPASAVRRQLELARASADLDLDLLVAMHGQALEPHLTAAAAELFGRDPAIARYLLRYDRTRAFDEVLCEALGSRSASSSASWIDETDLLATAWRPGRAEASFPDEDRAFYRAYTPRSRFLFVTDDEPAELAITWRGAPHFAPDDLARVFVDGVEVHRAELSSAWRSARVALPVRAGTRTIEIVWPTGAWDSTPALREAAAALAAGRSFDLRAAFGDVFRLELVVD